MAASDFNTEHLKGRAKRIAKAIAEQVTKDWERAPSGGGCTAFYTPKDWAARGERALHKDTVLVLVHDGGDLATYFGDDPWVEGRDAMTATIEKLGYRVEHGASWYSVVRPVEG